MATSSQIVGLTSSSSFFSERSSFRFKRACPTRVGMCEASPHQEKEAEAEAGSPPLIQIQLIGPESGTPQVDQVTSISGEKLLRNIILDNKLELYGLYGKVMNCGGGGSCGTCIVEILEGKELLNNRTDAENRYLKKKPDNWRLSCQTIVGDKINGGKLVVQRLPQKKK